MNKTIITVSQLNECVKLILENDELLTRVYVRGEISNLSVRNGHVYFTLKDEASSISAVMFARQAAGMKFRPESSMKVVVTGRIGVYTPRGQYQIIADSMEPDGVGALYLAYEQLKKKLASEGLFDEGLKKPIPRIPKAVGVITSPTGAALRDIVNITGRRFPYTAIIVYPSLVQGDGAEEELIAGLDYFNTVKSVDTIIIGRGGGSAEDLWAFNSEKLVRKIAASLIPVISAVGHETDFTLCDFAADRRAPTPSAAAELAVPDSRELMVWFSERKKHMRNALYGDIRELKEKLARLSGSRVLRTPTGFIDDRRIKLGVYYKELCSDIGRITERKRFRLSPVSGNALAEKLGRIIREKTQKLYSRAEKLDALSPLSVLGRGYAMVFSGDDKLIKSVDGVSPGQTIGISLRDGELSAEVVGKRVKHNENISREGSDEK